MRLGILFVHGIVGNNRIFQFLIPQIPAGCEQLWITLTGHGGNAADFSNASMTQWIQDVENGVKQLSETCGKIIIIAHSLGCLLALEQAAKGSVDGLLLLNPPLRIRIKTKALSNILKVILGMTDNDECASAALDAYGISIDYNPLHYLGWPKRYLELFREAHRIRNLVKNTRFDCTMAVIVSGKDELVSPKSMDFFASQPDCTVKYIPKSAHYYFTVEDKETIRTIFKNLTHRGEQL